MLGYQLPILITVLRGVKTLVCLQMFPETNTWDREKEEQRPALQRGGALKQRDCLYRKMNSGLTSFSFIFLIESHKRALNYKSLFR